MAANKPNWDKIRHEYVTTQIGQRPLAAKYKVSFSTLKARAQRESWAEAREEYCHTLSIKVAQKTERLAERQAEAIVVTKEEVLREFKRIGFGKITDIMSFNASGITLKDSAELTDDVAASIESVKEAMSADGESTLQVKRYNKIPALKELLRYIERHETTEQGDSGKAGYIDALKETAEQVWDEEEPEAEE